MLFTCIKSWFFRNHLANFHQNSHWSFCWNVIDSLFKWSCSIDCQAHIFFFKTKNCSNDDIFISCDDRIGKMLHNICMSAMAVSLRWANRGPWASCYFFCFFIFIHFPLSPLSLSFISSSRPRWLSWMRRPTGDQEVAGSTPAEVGNILSWRLIMKYFLQSFSPFRWFKKGSCQFLAKECAQYWLTA